MTKKQRLVLQRLLVLVSFLLAVVGTFLWYHTHLTGAQKPSWLMAVVAYGWMFVALFVFDKIAKAQARKRRPDISVNRWRNESIEP